MPLVVADMFAVLAFEGEMFDGAVGLHGALSHAPDVGALRGLASELRRVLRPGARVLFEEPCSALLRAPPVETEHVCGRGGGDVYVVTDRESGATWRGTVWPDEFIREAFMGFDVSITGAGPGERMILATTPLLNDPRRLAIR